ncbi:MAG: M20/M25/M40 family metallo-hydrolase [Thermaerobacter sp.]|nr:M20/M25/M40 family metallo-hydrolase [Thermaerobacter sp.]
MPWPDWLPPAPSLEQLAERLLQILEIPAPPFGEAARAARLVEILQARGLAPYQDAVGNVIVRWGESGHHAVAFLAHLDTALALPEISLRRADGRIYGHGSADDGSGLAVLTALAELAVKSGARPRHPVYFVANVGEEGLGDLRGARGFVADHETDLAGVVALDGRLGDIVHEGIASRRLEAEFHTPGGHSWSDYGSPSAVHLLGHAIARLDAMRLPREPRTTLNVGVISGGTAVNAIARKATCLIDLRSENAEQLQRLERHVREVFEGETRPPATVEFRCVGDRPGGKVPRSHPLVAAAAAALEEVGERVTYATGSTDANAALGVGVPGICCGVGRGALAHTPQEWLDEQSLIPGLEFAAALLTRIAPPA